jgi:DNA adenine methylase
MKRSKIRPVVKTHGGKKYLSPWLIDLFPQEEYSLYVEAFAGGGSVLLNKQPTEREVLNDIDSDLIAIWMVLKERSSAFIEELRTWSYTEESFQKAKDMTPSNQMEKAVKEYVLRRMSRGGMKKAFAWSKRLRGGKPGDVNAWETMLDLLPTIHQRLQNVEIRNESWEKVFEDYSSSEAFFYLDPPYVKSTRHKSATNVYDHEMTDKQHEKLLDACLNSSAKIMISGYQSPLYTSKLKKWQFNYKTIANHSSQTDRKAVKLECVWRNY